MTIHFDLDEKSIDYAIKEVNHYRDSLNHRGSKLVKEAADLLEQYAVYELSSHIETGETIDSLRTHHKEESTTATVSVGGAAVWLEFGTGVVANNCAPGTIVHQQYGIYLTEGIVGIGQYGEGHGADPNGWWYYDKEGRRRHTYGIPATMFMYKSAMNVRREIEGMARRIYRT